MHNEGPNQDQKSCGIRILENSHSHDSGAELCQSKREVERIRRETVGDRAGGYQATVPATPGVACRKAGGGGTCTSRPRKCEGMASNTHKKTRLPSCRPVELELYISCRPGLPHQKSKFSIFHVWSDPFLLVRRSAFPHASDNPYGGKQLLRAEHA